MQILDWNRYGKHASGRNCALPRARLSVLCLVAGVWLSGGLSAISQEMEFELGGELAFNHFGLNGELQSAGKRRFRVFVQGDKWRIETERVGESKGQALRWTMASLGDGQIFQVGYFTNRATIANADLEAVPTISMDHSAAFLWLGFVSRPYFESLTNDMAFPVWTTSSLDISRRNERMKTTWSYLDGLPGFPSEIVFHHGPYWRGRTRDGVPVETPIGPPFEDGFVNAEYKVTGSTNSHGLVFPLSFIFRVTLPDFSGKGGKEPLLTIRTLVNGRLDAFAAKPSIDEFLPDLPPGAGVLDRRLRYDEPPAEAVTYGVMNGRWLSLADLRETYKTQKGTDNGAFARAGQSVAITPPAAKSRIGWLGRVAILVFLGGIVPAAFYLANRRKA